MVIYELSRVAFGMKSSPYLALRTVQQLALDEAANCPKASETVLRDTYMDDLVCSVKASSQAEELYRELIELFKSGGFDLLKWCTITPELLEKNSRRTPFV